MAKLKQTTQRDRMKRIAEEMIKEALGSIRVEDRKLSSSDYAILSDLLDGVRLEFHWRA